MNPNSLPQPQNHREQSQYRTSDGAWQRQQDQNTETSPARNPRYSYMETPIELHPPNFPPFSRGPESTLPQAPAPDHQPISLQDPPYSPYPVDKPSVDRAASPYSFPPPQEPHPAQFAPYADSISQATPRKVSKTLDASLPPSSIPEKSQQETPEFVSTNANDTNHGSALSVVYAGRSSPTTERGHDSQWNSAAPKQVPIYNPNSISGPNGLTAASHQPGQSVHPNMDLNDGQWRHDLCGCDASICALGLCCPCILYGKTEYRLSQRAEKRDPTDLLGHSACNGSCSLMAIACGFQCMQLLIFEHILLLITYNQGFWLRYSTHVSEKHTLCKGP